MATATGPSACLNPSMSSGPRKVWWVCPFSKSSHITWIQITSPTHCYAKCFHMGSYFPNVSYLRQRMARGTPGGQLLPRAQVSSDFLFLLTKYVTLYPMFSIQIKFYVNNQWNWVYKYPLRAYYTPTVLGTEEQSRSNADKHASWWGKPGNKDDLWKYC